MSIFNLDWNNDGNIDIQDTMIDMMLLNEMEEDEKDGESFFDFDDED
ncbi:MAG: hypothetical protein MR773_04605 [Eubacterium coprostanoligenes]|nr:hypothetical protein [Eubacterium coprostanoligenes]